MTGSTTPRLTHATAVGSWTLDPTGSTAAFQVKHFWGAITVRGTLRPVAGEATVSTDGGVTGRIGFDTRSLDTGHKKRDEHLRSADFFHTDEHPQAVLTVSSAHPAGPDEWACEGVLDVAGHTRRVSFTAHIQEATERAVVVSAELEVDRAEFGMTWSPLHMASMTALGTVTARFTRD
jgi:polyisoprenoid-binding protein YceI